MQVTPFVVTLLLIPTVSLYSQPDLPVNPQILRSGKPGVILVTSGPGATNTVTALQDALMDGVPLVAFTGQVRFPYARARVCLLGCSSAYSNCGGCL